MNAPTQVPEPPAPGPGAPTPASAAPPGGVFDAARIERGLATWLAIILAGAALCALLGHMEAAAIFAAAGLLALAQASDAAADLDRWRAFVFGSLPRGSVRGVLTRLLVRAVVPLAGALMFAALGNEARRQPGGAFATAWCGFAVLACLLLAWRPAADAVMRACFGGLPGRTRRLTGRLIVMALMLPVPAALLVPPLLAELASSGQSLVDAPGLVAQLLGEIALALAGVGWFVRRDLRGVIDRLGLGALRPRDALVIVGGVAAILLLNHGTEWIAIRAFPALWRQDAAVTALMAAHLPVATSLLLGVSAGVGEELLMRGALQPRLGIRLTAIVFACGHVQYSWFGMLTIALLGMVLGVIRARTNTTVAIVVHAIYDVVAVLVPGA